MGARRLIRLAGEADIPRLIDMIERLVEAVNGPQRVDRLRTGQTLAGLIHDPKGVVLASGAGFIAGCITQTVISPDPVAVELGWFCEDHSGADLLRAFENWSAEQGAALVKMTCTGGAVQTMLERAGYRAAEIQMVK